MSVSRMGLKREPIKDGEIWIVKFHPRTGNELAKYRPAVVVRSLDSIDDRFVLIAPLTSSEKQNQFELTLQHSALEKESTLLLWYLWTVDVRRLEERVGVLSVEQRDEVRKLLVEFLG